MIGVLETSWVLPASFPVPLDASLQAVGTGGAVFIDGSKSRAVGSGRRPLFPFPISLIGRWCGTVLVGIWPPRSTTSYAR